MNNFKLLGKLDVKFDIPPELWKKETWRQFTEGTAHADTETIFLKMVRERTRTAIFNDCIALWEESGVQFRRQLWAVAHLIGYPQLGRIMLVKLRAKGHVVEHIDQGRYAEFYDRMHYVVSGMCNFHCGDEEVVMCPGEAWWFNHRLTHSVYNPYEQDRVSLIIDYRRQA